MKFTSKDLENLERNLNNPLRIMKQLGELMRSRIQNSFADQVRGKFAWRERGVPNVMGVVSDLEKGSTIKARRFDARPALTDTGTLKKSFGRGKENIVMPTKLTVEVGTPVIYAPKLNEGGTSEKKITPQVKKNLSKYLKRTEKRIKERNEALDKGKDDFIDDLIADSSPENIKKAKKKIAKRLARITSEHIGKNLGWLLKKNSVKVTIPARPFAIITQRDLQDQVKIIEGNFLK